MRSKDKQEMLKEHKVFRVFKALQSKDKQVTLKVLSVVQDFKVSKVPKEHLVFKDKQENLKVLQVTQDFRVLKVLKEHLVFRGKQENLKVPLEAPDFKVFKVFKVLQSKVKLVNPKVLLVLKVTLGWLEILVLKEHLVFKDKQVMHKDFRVCKDYKV